MSFLVATADGNLTGSNWCAADHNLVSTSTGTTTLTTVDQDSPAFTCSAVALIGVAIRVAQRTAGAATNKISVNLRNTTRSTDNIVQANVSDLPACTAGQDSEGGWHFFKFAAAYTPPAGTDNHILRIKLDSTSTPVQIATNGTGLNWQRMVIKQATSSPVAADDMYVIQTLDGSTTPATAVSRTITMDSTTNTAYGTGPVNSYLPSLSVSKNATLAYGIAASTNYYLKNMGWVTVFSGGTFNIGTSGSEIPRNSTAIFEINNSSDGTNGLRILNGGIFNAYGLSRTSGKDVWMCKLSADHAAAAATINVDTDTGWLNGDEVDIASTARAASQNEVRTLNANAGASSFTISAGLTNSHLGSGDYFAEVMLLTRNVEIRGTPAGNSTFLYITSTAVVTCKWTRFRYYSSLSNFFTIQTTTGSANFQYCVFRDGDAGITTSGSTWSGLTLDKCLFVQTGGAGAAVTLAATTGTWTLTDVAFMNSSSAVNFQDVGGTIGNMWVMGCSNGWLWAQNSPLNNATGGPTFTGSPTWICHSCDGGAGAAALAISVSMQDITFPTFKFWRNSCDAIQLASNLGMSNIEFTGDFFGNGVAGQEFPCCFRVSGGGGANANAITDVRFNGCNISGDTLYQANWGCLFDKANVTASEIYWYNCKFSENTGTRRPLLVADIGAIPDVDAGGMLLQGVAEWCTFGAPESVKYFYATGPQPRLASKYSYVSCPGYGQSTTAHRVYTAYGTIIRDTTTFDVTPSQNVKPIASTSLAVNSNAFRKGTGFLVGVSSGVAVTVSVKVQIDGTYNGLTKPELVVLKNRALGITTDTVLATHGGGTGSFLTLSGTTAAPAADGVLEFVVRCYGTAGNAYIDTWSTSSAGQDTTGVKYWNGQPVTYANTSGGGAAGTPTSAAYLG